MRKAKLSGSSTFRGVKTATAAECPTAVNPGEEPMGRTHHCSHLRTIVIVTINVNVILKRR
jgi:hypothetical protein